MLDLSQYKLGETSPDIILESKEDNYAAVLALTGQARRSIHLFSPDLDSEVFNKHEITEQLKNLAVKDRHTIIKILIHDSRKIVLNGHQFIELARLLSSSIEIRKIPVELRAHSETFLIVDETGLLYRTQSDRYEGLLKFDDRRQCRHLLDFFNKSWEHSTPDPELKRLYI